MLAKWWKKIGLIILIIACLIDIGCKLASKVSFNDFITDAKSSFSRDKNAEQKSNQK